MLVLGVVAAGLVPLAVVICACGVVLIRDPTRRRDAVLALWVLVDRSRSVGPKQDLRALARVELDVA